MSHWLMPDRGAYDIRLRLPITNSRLDLNLSYGGTLPRIKNNLKHGMLNLSFDIKIAEYLSALTKKKG